jgi:hypothetical protein
LASITSLQQATIVSYVHPLFEIAFRGGIEEVSGGAQTTPSSRNCTSIMRKWVKAKVSVISRCVPSRQPPNERKARADTHLLSRGQHESNRVICTSPLCRHPKQPLVAITARSIQLWMVRPPPLDMLQRKSTIISSRRISSLFSPRLMPVTDQVVRRASDPARLVIPTVRESRSSKDSSRGGLHDILDSANPAESPTESYLILENKYPALRSLRTDDDIGDGLWICCHCHHENILRHWNGPYPFKYLRCDRCTRKLCSSCHSTEVLTPWPIGMISAPRPAVGREVRYCHMCTTCGLTHRAEMAGTTLDFYGVTCAGCDTSSYGEWPRYHIGNVEPYRRDPDSSFVKLIEARADDAAKLAFQWEMADTESEPRSELNCRNPS